MYEYMYSVPRDVVNYAEWINLCDQTASSSYMYTDIEEYANGRGGYENDVFRIIPYDWDETLPRDTPNFLYKPTEFAIQWYKYPFRGAWMTHDYNKKELRKVFSECISSVKKDLENIKGDME